MKPMYERLGKDQLHSPKLNSGILSPNSNAAHLESRVLFVPSALHPSPNPWSLELSGVPLVSEAKFRRGFLDFALQK